MHRHTGLPRRASTKGIIKEIFSLIRMLIGRLVKPLLMFMRLTDCYLHPSVACFAFSEILYRHSLRLPRLPRPESTAWTAKYIMDVFCDAHNMNKSSMGRAVILFNSIRNLASQTGTYTFSLFRISGLFLCATAELSQSRSGVHLNLG